MDYLFDFKVENVNYDANEVQNLIQKVYYT